MRRERGIPRNFGLFLSHFKEETFDPCFSRLRTRRSEEFCLIPRPFRGQDETLENFCSTYILGPLPPYFVEVIYGWSLVDFNIPQAPNLEHIVSHTGYIKSYANYPALDCI